MTLVCAATFAVSVVGFSILYWNHSMNLPRFSFFCAVDW